MSSEYRPHPESGIHEDPADFALALHEHVADGVGEDSVDAYLVDVIREVFAISPAVREQVLGEDAE